MNALMNEWGCEKASSSDTMQWKWRYWQDLWHRFVIHSMKVKNLRELNKGKNADKNSSPNPPLISSTTSRNRLTNLNSPSTNVVSHTKTELPLRRKSHLWKIEVVNTQKKSSHCLSFLLSSPQCHQHHKCCLKIVVIFIHIHLLSERERWIVTKKKAKEEKRKKKFVMMVCCCQH